MFDPVPQAATLTFRVRLSDFWEWFKNLFSSKKGTTLVMDYLGDSADIDGLDSDKTPNHNSLKQIGSALRPKNNCMETGSPLTPGKDTQNPWDSDEEAPQSVVEMTAKNWLFSKLAAVVLAIGEAIKNAITAFSDHVRDSMDQYSTGCVNVARVLAPRWRG